MNKAELIQSILREIKAINIGAEQRNDLMVVSLSTVIASHLTLPSGVVNSITTYYNSEHSRTVTMLLSDINEQIVFDIQAAREMVKRAYLLRYTMAYAPSKLSTSTLLLEALETDTYAVDERYREFLTDNKNLTKSNKLRTDLTFYVSNCLNPDGEE